MARLLSELLSFPVKGPIRGLRFVLNTINEQVAAEYLDEGKVQADLLDLTLRYQHGEIDDTYFEEQQRAIVQHLNDIQKYKQGQATEMDETSAEGAVSEE